MMPAWDLTPAVHFTEQVRIVLSSGRLADVKKGKHFKEVKDRVRKRCTTGNNRRSKK